MNIEKKVKKNEESDDDSDEEAKTSKPEEESTAWSALDHTISPITLKVTYWKYIC